MVVKGSRGRRRYVAYTLEKTISKSDLERMLSNGYGRIHVIQCAGGWCIIRCEPNMLERADELMRKACPGCESKSTSGNLLTLRRKYPILWETRPRYIAFTVSLDNEDLSAELEKRADDDGPVLKFCDRGYAIVRCPLRNVDRTIAIMKEVDPSSEPFLSSYNSKDIRKEISNRVPELRSSLLARN